MGISFNIQECIDAIEMGNHSFSSLKEITIDRTNTFDGYVWSSHNFIVVNILVKGEEYKMKIFFKNGEDESNFFNSIDRSSTFYSDIFTKMESHIKELKIGENRYDIALLKSNYIKTIISKELFISKFIELICKKISHNIVIDKFSLVNCVNVDNNLKVSLENSGVIVTHHNTTPDLLIAYKNYLIALLLYIIDKYNETNYDKFIKSSPKFRIVSYKQYLTESYLKGLFPIEHNNEVKSLYDLLFSTNRPKCIKELSGVVNTSDNIEEQTLEIDNNYIINGILQESRMKIKEKTSGKIGFTNEHNQIVINPIYDSATNFEEGISVVSIDNIYGAINCGGDKIIGIEYNELIWSSDYNIFIFCKDNLYGLLSRVGETVVPAKYLWIDKFSNALARFQNIDKRFGFIDLNGKAIISAQWDNATKFKNGSAKVCKDEVWYITDEEGKII